MKTCPYDTAVLIERQPETTIGKPEYKCLACGRIYEMRYPASATQPEYLVVIYDPEQFESGASG